MPDLELESVDADKSLDTSYDQDSIKSTQALAEVHQDDLNQITAAAVETPDERSLNPDLDKFMVACQQGNLADVKRTIVSKSVAANDTFSDGITGLHWASINNRLSVVKYLVENDVSKAAPNIFGGELNATPLHWACRNGLVYIVHYLLQNGADPSLKDSQGYNALHLSVHSSNIMLVIYMLYQCCSGLKNSSIKQIYIDEPDKSSRTCLHWACYQGDVLSVQVLLKLGADVNKADESLFIPLHWAFMRCYKGILKLLIENGSDLFVKNDKGKDSFAVAKDMECAGVYYSALNECGKFEKNGWQIKENKFDPKYGKLITFFVPYVILPVLFRINNFNEGLVIPKLFVSSLIVMATYHLLIRFIIPTYLIDKKPLPKTPLLAGLFSGSLFWTAVVTCFSITPRTLFSGFLAFWENLLLLALVCVIAYTFFKAMFINPGFIPVPADNHVVYYQIIELINNGKFDTDHFCPNTCIQKPLRAKYSNYNKKLIARFDHYCPWVYNEIGVRNHKLFMFFVYSLTLGAVVFSNMSFKLFSILEDGYGSDSDENCFLEDELCVAFKHSNFHFNLLIWTWLQFIWIFILCLTQTFQILKGLTTYEFSVLNSGPKIYNHSTLPLDFRGEPTPQETPLVERRTVINNPCCKLLGLDQFVLTVKIAVYALLKRELDVSEQQRFFNIPTDYGIKQNWLDFWFLGDIKLRNLFFLPIEGENNLNGQVVDYYKLYEYPAKSAAELA